MRPSNAFSLSIIMAGTALGLGWVAVSITASPAFSPLDLGATQNLSDSETPSHGAVIAVVSDTIHVVWVETVYGWPEIYHTYRAGDSGWRPPARLEAGTQPALSVGPDGTVDLVWLDESVLGGSFNTSFIRYRRWNNALQMWLDSANVDVGSLGTIDSPSVAVGPGGETHVIWVDSVGGSPTIRYRRRSGSAWSSPQNVAFGSEPDIAVDADGTLHMVWSGTSILGQTHDIYYRWRDPQGDWSLTYVLSDREGADSVIPAIAVDPAGALHVSWREIAGDSQTISYRSGYRSSWPVASERVSPLLTRVGAPAIAVNAQHVVHLAFSSGAGLQHVVKEPAINTWVAADPIAENEPDATSPELAAGEEATLHVVWTAPGTAGQPDIYYQAAVPHLEPMRTPTVIATATATVTLTPIATSTAPSTPTLTPSVSRTPTSRPSLTATWTPVPTGTSRPSPSPTATLSPELTGVPLHEGYLPFIVRNRTRSSANRTSNRSLWPALSIGSLSARWRTASCFCLWTEVECSLPEAHKTMGGVKFVSPAKSFTWLGDLASR
ncbi:MAG: hypothetical protein ACE5F6_07345 [Anaerolineae bacterium]